MSEPGKRQSGVGKAAKAAKPVLMAADWPVLPFANLNDRIWNKDDIMNHGTRSGDDQAMELLSILIQPLNIFVFTFN